MQPLEFGTDARAQVGQQSIVKVVLLVGWILINSSVRFKLVAFAAELTVAPK